MTMMGANGGAANLPDAGVPAGRSSGRRSEARNINHHGSTSLWRLHTGAGAVQTQEAEMARTLSACLVVIAAALSACGAAPTSAATAKLQQDADKYAIDQIEVIFHRAASTHNVDLMMTLYADDAVATIGGQTYTGKAEIRNLFATKAAPFKPQNHWVSDTPAYKIKTTVNGDKGTLYFECHYIDINKKTVQVVVGADQQVARIGGKWLITELVSSSPDLGS